MIEEYYESILIIIRMEKMLNNILNHQIYMHYHQFARIQSLGSSLYIMEIKQNKNQDSNTFE